MVRMGCITVYMEKNNAKQIRNISPVIEETNKFPRSTQKQNIHGCKALKNQSSVLRKEMLTNKEYGNSQYHILLLLGPCVITILPVATYYAGFLHHRSPALLITKFPVPGISPLLPTVIERTCSLERRALPLIP